MPTRDGSAAVSEWDRARRAVPRLVPVGSCPICTARDSEVFFHSPDLLHGVPGEFTYRRCGSCRTVFQDPRVVAEDIPLCYPDGYYTHSTGVVAVETRGDEQALERRFGGVRNWMRDAIIGTLLQSRQVTWLRTLGTVLARSGGLRERAFFGLLDELIPRHIGAARALDVGCGAGHLMVALARAGWIVEGLEPDPMAAEVARRTSGCHVTVGSLLTADLPSATFELVVLGHVFEHLDDPDAAFKRIAELLTSTGRAVLVYPNPESLGARLFRGLWSEWDPPRHLVIPPVRAICDALARHGFQSASMRTATRGIRTFTCSRSLRAGLPVSTARIDLVDRLLENLSKLMVRAGLPLGEEIVVSVEKGARGVVRGQEP